MWSLCDNSNAKAWMAEKLYGYAPAGIFGYSHMMGGYAGGQAEYARLPFADVGPIKVQDELTDEQVLFLSDIFPTGYMAAETATSNRAIQSPSGVVGRLVSSRSKAPICLARSA
jgi:threonine dehydrogenase-like Zn-dependent dehydrogenase